MPIELEALSPEEKAQMLDAIPLISILVGAADGELDEAELKAATQLAHIRSYKEELVLQEYYDQMEGKLALRIRELLGGLPKDTSERQALLSEKLAALNPILAKLPSPYNYYYYASFRSFADHVARASGGFFRFLTIGPKEAKVVGLPMLEVIEEPAE